MHSCIVVAHLRQKEIESDDIRDDAARLLQSQFKERLQNMQEWLTENPIVLGKGGKIRRVDAVELQGTFDAYEPIYPEFQRVGTSLTTLSSGSPLLLLISLKLRVGQRRM